MAIFINDKVGIGDTTPPESLSVSGAVSIRAPGAIEQTTIVCTGDTAGSLSGTYFTLSDGQNNPYYCWIDTGGSTDPAPGGTGIQAFVDFDSQSPDLTAQRVITALAGFPQFRTAPYVTPGTVYLSNRDPGPADDATAGTTDFTVTPTVQGGNTPQGYSTFRGQNQSGLIEYRLPLTQGAGGTFLANDGLGDLSWTPPTPTVGAPVIGGLPYTLLSVDGSGNLASYSTSQWDANTLAITGLVTATRNGTDNSKTAMIASVNHNVSQDDQSADQIGIDSYIQVTLNGAEQDGLLVGTRASVSTSGTGPVFTAVAMQGRLLLDGGSIQRSTAIDAVLNITDTHVQQLYDFRSDSASISGTVTVDNHYGLFLNKNVGATSEWGIWQQDTAAVNFFAGKLGIGTTSPSDLLAVGATSQFCVDSNGNLIRINDIPYTWPASQGAAGSVLTDSDGAGTLVWGTTSSEPLAGDVTGTLGATVVSLVGGVAAASVASGASAANAATATNTASTIVKRDGSGNFAAGTITANLTGLATDSTNSVNFTGSLNGDVTGTQTTTSVANVGGSTAANINFATVSTLAATPLATAFAIVRRDASGNFAATAITANLTGNVTGTATNVTGIVAIANGGTGQSTANAGFNALSPMTTAGDLIYGGASGVGTRLAAGTATQVLHGGTTPSWGAVDLATAQVTGVLPNANTTATSANTASTIVARDASGNFTAGTITANLTGNASGTSATFTGSLTGDVTSTGMATTIATGAVTDTKASLATKPAVTVVATTNQTLSGTPTIDGQATAAGSLILLTAQTTGSQNGPWVAAAGSWTRPTWYPAGGTTQAFQFITSLVRLGTVYQGSIWRMTTAGAITIDTTATTWAVTTHSLSAATVVRPTVTKTANYTITTSDNIIFADSSGGAFNLTLPTAVAGQIYEIIDSTGSFATNNVTLVPAGSAKISGLAANKALQTAWGTYRAISNGTDWYLAS